MKLNSYKSHINLHSFNNQQFMYDSSNSVKLQHNLLEAKLEHLYESRTLTPFGCKTNEINCKIC